MDSSGKTLSQDEAHVIRCQSIVYLYEFGSHDGTWYGAGSKYICAKLKRW